MVSFAHGPIHPCRHHPAGDCFSLPRMGGRFVLSAGDPRRPVPDDVQGGTSPDYHPVSIGNDQVSQGFINERLRLWLTVQTSDNVEGYVGAGDRETFFGVYNYDLPKTLPPRERPTIRWASVLRYRVPRLPQRLPGPGAGIQPWQDGFRNIIHSRLGFQAWVDFLGAKIPGARRHADEVRNLRAGGGQRPTGGPNVPADPRSRPAGGR